MPRTKVQGPKLFTLEEAEAMLPFIEKQLARGHSFLERFEAVRKELSILRLVSASGGLDSNPDQEALLTKQHEEAALVREIRAVEAALLESGCVPKSLTDGLVDFFAQKDGRLVFLCWKRGESHIGAWHTLDGGFAGRRPIASFKAGKTANESS